MPRWLQARQPLALIYAVPLLVESGTWRQRVSRIVTVDCPEECKSPA
jgi:dephospho-CoA kinase